MWFCVIQQGCSTKGKESPTFKELKKRYRHLLHAASCRYHTISCFILPIYAAIEIAIQKLSSLSKGRGQKDFEKNSHSVNHMPAGRCCTNTTVQCRLCNVILGASA